jgi:hypothetical protein
LQISKWTSTGETAFIEQDVIPVVIPDEPIEVDSSNDQNTADPTADAPPTGTEMELVTETEPVNSQETNINTKPEAASTSASSGIGAGIAPSSSSDAAASHNQTNSHTINTNANTTINAIANTNTNVDHSVKPNETTSISPVHFQGTPKLGINELLQIRTVCLLYKTIQLRPDSLS